MFRIFRLIKTPTPLWVTLFTTMLLAPLVGYAQTDVAVGNFRFITGAVSTCVGVDASRNQVAGTNCIDTSSAIASRIGTLNSSAGCISAGPVACPQNGGLVAEFTGDNRQGYTFLGNQGHFCGFNASIFTCDGNPIALSGINQNVSFNAVSANQVTSATFTGGNYTGANMTLSNSLGVNIETVGQSTFSSQIIANNYGVVINNSGGTDFADIGVSHAIAIDGSRNTSFANVGGTNFQVNGTTFVDGGDNGTFQGLTVNGSLNINQLHFNAFGGSGGIACDMQADLGGNLGDGNSYVFSPNCEFQGSAPSRLEWKKDVQPYNFDPLAVLEKTRFAMYHYNGKNHLPNEKASAPLRIGIIADTTPTQISGLRHRHFDSVQTAAIDGAAIVELHRIVKRQGAAIESLRRELGALKAHKR